MSILYTSGLNVKQLYSIHKWLKCQHYTQVVKRLIMSIFHKKSLKIPKGNQKPYIEEEQTTQWPKEKERTNNDRQNIHIKLKIE